MSKWHEWSDQHTLAVAWAAYMAGLATMLSTNFAHAMALAPTVFLMVGFTGWLVRWWQGAAITASVAIVFGLLGLLRVDLQLGTSQRSNAVSIYVFGLVILAVGRLARLSWQRWGHAKTLTRDLAAAHEREAFQAQFFSMAAHEIGTPLTPLKLQVQALLMRPEAAPLESGLLRIQRNVDRLEHLSKDLLDSSRIHSGTMQVQPRPARIDSVLAEVVGACRAAAEEAEVVVSLDAEPMQAVVDSDRIGQVVWNLVSNALKFTPPGGHIRIRASMDGDVRIRVEDDGMGMTPEQVESLFLPFTQFPRERVRGGTGLGLFVSAGICKAHNGSITASSRGPGQGSTFEIRLPLVEAPPEVIELAPRAVQA